MDKLRLCLNCRNFEVLENKREFENIADTAYLVYRCRLQGTIMREDYLMKPVPPVFTLESRPTECPFWAHWALEPHQNLSDSSCL